MKIHNKKKVNVLLMILISLVSTIHSAEFFNFNTSTKKDEESKLQVILGDEKKIELSLLKKEIISLEEQHKHIVQEIAPFVERTKADLATTELDARRMGKNDKFLSKKTAALQSLSQTFVMIQGVWTSLVSLIKQHIILLEDYLKDSDFELVKIDKKSYYTFDDFQQLNNRIATQEEKVKLIEIEKKDVGIEFANRKKKLVKTEADYKECVQKQSDFSTQTEEKEIDGSGGGSGNDFSIRQKGQLLDIQVLSTRYETILAENNVKEIEIQKAFLASKYDIEFKKMQVLKKRQDFFIKVSLRIDEKDIEKAQRDKDYEYNNYIAKSNHVIQEINELTQAKTQLVSQLKSFEEEYGTIVASQDWSAKPTTLQGYQAIVTIGFKKEQIATIDRHIELLKIESDIEKAKFTRKDVFLKIIQLWKNIQYNVFDSHEDANLHVKKCEELQTELVQTVTTFDDKRKIITDKLSGNTKNIANINELMNKLGRYQNGSLGGDDQKYKDVVITLQKARELILKQNEEAGKLVERYSDGISTLQQPIQQINTLVSELHRVSLWHRSGRAISLQGIKSIIPDLKTFVMDVKAYGDTYVNRISLDYIAKTIVAYVYSPLALLFLFFKLLFLYLLFFIIRAQLIPFSVMLMGVSREFASTYTLSFALAMILRFLYQHSYSFFPWLLFFLYYVFIPSFDIYPALLFFLGSMIYLFILIRHFVAFIVSFNAEHEEVFFSDIVQSRFIAFLQWFLYITVIILPFREAFMLMTYAKSEFPDILLAIYSIIVRILLLSLLRKDDILHFIPTKTTVWAWVWRVVDNYYYSILWFFIFLMILIDPYLGGYNNLISYFAWGTIGTCVISKILYETYLFVRRALALVLFMSDGESLKERFQLSKVFYGVMVIVLFMAFIFIALILISRLWHKPITVDMINDFFTAGRLSIKLDDQYRKLSILEILGTFSFIPLGLLTSFVVDKFILHRIFSVLLVSPGVHNAVSTIIYYLIIILVITFGLWSHGFGFIIAFYLTPILLSMMWALRDVMGDFVSYFVILIQRPIKVGDFIKLDQDVYGVVRSITPRAVILRKQQSFVQIVPNARILRDTIYNWDYYLNYIAIPDIFVSVGYQCNPDQVRTYLLTAVETTAGILRIPVPTVRLEEFSPSGFTFLVRGFISHEKTLEQWNIASEVRLSIVRLLRTHDIEISAPLRVVKVIDGKL